MKFASLFVFQQEHKFNYTYDPTEGYRIKLNELTDGGIYTCHAQDDIDLENAMDFVVYVNCKFKINFFYSLYLKAP